MPSLHQSVPQLRRRRLGVIHLVFFTVAASAPLTVLGGGVTTTFAVTGNAGVPLSFLMLALALALFAVGYAAMSRHVANAGAFYSYLAKGLGRVWGVAGAFVALISYNAIQIGLYGLFGAGFADFAASSLGIDLPWFVWALRGAAAGRHPRRAAGRPQRLRARRPAGPRDHRGGCSTTSGRSATRPAAPSRRDGLPRRRSCSRRASVRSSPSASPAFIGFESGRDLQRGVPQPAGHRRPRDLRGVAFTGASARRAASADSSDEPIRAAMQSLQAPKAALGPVRKSSKRRRKEAARLGQPSQVRSPSSTAHRAVVPSNSSPIGTAAGSTIGRFSTSATGRRCSPAGGWPKSAGHSFLRTCRAHAFGPRRLGRAELVLRASARGRGLRLHARAFLATGLVPRTLNLRAVASYLSFAYVPGCETLRRPASA